MKATQLEATDQTRAAAARRTVHGRASSSLALSPRVATQRAQHQAMFGLAIQRKNLKQAGLGDDVALVTEGKRTLVGDGRDVNMYYRSADAAGDRTAGLVKAAEVNAALGRRVDDWGFRGKVGKRRDEEWKQNNMYTPTKKPLDTDRVRNVDPFFLYVTIRYGEGGANEQLDIIYQHAPAFTGYVEQVMDTTNAQTADYPSMFNKYSSEAHGAKINSGDVAKSRNLKFSNVHDQGDNAGIATLTGGGGEKNLDAYTKIAGEGARWQAVRSHARSLKNSSRFYTQSPGNPNQVYAVDFVSLWLSWESAFGKQYDISNGHFAKMMREAWQTFKGSGVKAWAKAAMTGDDYNLDA